MRLTAFQVTSFKSVQDSGWIDVDPITALIGTNESGKTNLLMPLWKLKPAKDGEVRPLQDYPRKDFNAIRGADPKPTFIRARFELSSELTDAVSKLTSAPESEVSIIEVSRTYDDKIYVRFPNAKTQNTVHSSRLIAQVQSARDTIEAAEPSSSDIPLKAAAIKALDDILASVEGLVELSKKALSTTQVLLKSVDTENALKRSVIAPAVLGLREDIDQLITEAARPTPGDNAEARKLVWDAVPSFVYYSNYGNLDSEIYLPHVLANMKRNDLGSKEEAKVRTLKVLFDFVGLEPNEILDLGQGVAAEGDEPTDAEIEEAAERTKEREVLLQSASSSLTKRFREWWKQGDYRFRFQADGDHFRIWVSDDKRPEEIELEGRSTGLQWFLSFYLIFLVESEDAHQNAILLLDEPGLSLHPLAQEDLSLFFENLSKTNQLLYTTHSPFLVDPNNLDRVKAVYVDGDGYTRISADLRAADADPSQSRSVYPVHAALGLSVSQTLFQGCQPVIVEGQSDQILLSAVKTLLAAQGKIRPRRELLFVPCGGVKGVKAVVSLLLGRDADLPQVFLDGDDPGQQMAQHLLKDLYKADAVKVQMASQYSEVAGAEIEDLFPADVVARIVDRMFRVKDEDFVDVVDSALPIVPQIKGFAEKHGVELEEGWKVDLAKQIKARIQSHEAEFAQDKSPCDQWQKLFETFG